MSDEGTHGWYAYDGGTSIGSRGCEGGVTLLDEEHPDGARITLERDGDTAPFAITCGIYGWTYHTRFFATQEEAEAEYSRMKVALAVILAMIPYEKDPDVRRRMAEVAEAIGRFVDEFP